MSRQLEEKIEKMQDQLQRYEDIDPLYQDEELKKLNNQIIFIHSRLEASVNIIISRAVLLPMLPEVRTANRRILSTLAIENILDKMDFAKKVNLAKELGPLDGEDIVGKLYQVNNYRVWFSHPKTHQEEIRKLNDRKEYAKVLEDLITTYEAMNQYFVTHRIGLDFIEED